MHHSDMEALVRSVQPGDTVIAQLWAGSTVVAGVVCQGDTGVKYIPLSDTTGLFLNNLLGVKELILVKRHNMPGKTATCNEILVQLVNEFDDWAAEAAAEGASTEAGIVRAVNGRILAVASSHGRPISFDTPVPKG